jgi:hypothetical protein
VRVIWSGAFHPPVFPCPYCISRLRRREPSGPTHEPAKQNGGSGTWSCPGFFSISRSRRPEVQPAWPVACGQDDTFCLARCTGR